jgi:glucose/arabinose dehydrogenase
MIRRSVREEGSRALARALAIAVVVTGAAAQVAGAATSCHSLSCQDTCTPTTPFVTSTLVAGFPDGADTPVAFVDPDDGRRRRFVATREGAVFVWDGITGLLRPTPFLDLRDDVGGPVTDTGSDQGLLSLAVDPDYASTGRLYLLYTRADLGPGTVNDVVISRYERSLADPDVADPASATAIMILEHGDSLIHSGGMLAFGPDGFLYISTGDASGHCDDNEGSAGNGQRTDVLSGKILRLDVRGVDPAAGAPDDCGVLAGPYEVPSSNPFFGVEPACDEIWATGFRNPFRFAIDRSTGNLFVGDVGENKWEEIDLVPAASIEAPNFGWGCREGCETAANDESQCSVPGCPADTGTTCEFPRASGFTDPVLCHHNPGWRSIVAGARYRGTRLPGAGGRLFYGDAQCGQIWASTELDPAQPDEIASECFKSGVGPVYAFGEDHLGELYLAKGWQGTVECVHAGDGCYWAGWAGTFEDGFESGGTARWDVVQN